MTRPSIVCLACVLFGCTASSPPTDGGRTSDTAPTPTEPAPTIPPTQAPTSAPTSGPDASSAAGKWLSPSCGSRKYAREIDLQAGGTFAARDLVSPCPKGAVCVWSGIVDRSGKWSQSGAKIVLTVETGADAKPGVGLPAELAFEGGALVEKGDGADKCVYTRP